MKKAIELKSQVVAEITDKLNRAASVVVVDYKGLTVAEVTELRKQMRDAGVDYKVYKNTLVRRAAKEVGIEQFNDTDLVGTNAIAFGYDDPVEPAKIIKNFMEKAPNLELKMGVVEGEFYDKDKMLEIASIPSREELIGKLLGSLKSPISDFVYLVDAIAKNFEEEREGKEA